MKKPHWKTIDKAIRNSVQTLSQSELVKAFHTSLLKQLQPWVLDTKYRAVSLEVWRLIVAYNGVDREKYTSEFFDCDNFATCLAGDVAQRWGINGIGVVLDFSAAHAYNCALTVDTEDRNALKIIVIEPQTDHLFLDTSLPYAAKHGVVTFS